jgi:hypothetical protein
MMRGSTVDEISVLTAIRPDVPEFPAADRLARRERLLAAIAADPAGVADPAGAANPAGAARPSRHFRPRWTRIALGSLTVAASAAIAAGLLIALPSGPARQRPTAVASQPATAAAVLLRAAQAMATAPELTPGPHQFIYTEQIIKGQVEDDNGRIETLPTFYERGWTSANGQWGGLTQSSYQSSGPWSTLFDDPVCAIPDPSNPNWKGNCPLPAGYQTDLPRTTSGMLAYLLQQGNPRLPAAYRVLDGITEVESWPSGFLMPNRSYALMFAAASTVKGIEVIRHITDTAGRSGIAVAACTPGCAGRIELIFDASTYQFIGADELTLHGSPEPGTIAAQALLRIAIVARIGQLP